MFTNLLENPKFYEKYNQILQKNLSFENSSLVIREVLKNTKNIIDCKSIKEYQSIFNFIVKKYHDEENEKKLVYYKNLYRFCSINYPESIQICLNIYENDKFGFKLKYVNKIKNL